MNLEQLKVMAEGKGFIAALDQSGGSTPKALKGYGIDESEYNGEDEMFAKVHEMRTRVITSPSFNQDRFVGAILFEGTMDRTVRDRYTADFLWNVKGIVPFLKIDKGLADLKDGAQVMKPNPGLGDLLVHARDDRGIFGTKMRSNIMAANADGIKAVVDQQFEVAMQIADAGLVPIIEPEVNIDIPDKAKAEDLLLENILRCLKDVPEDTKLMFKITLPDVANLYKPLIEAPQTVRVVALSGGYPLDVANEKLAANNGVIASYSRALLNGLTAQQSDEEFNKILAATAQAAYEASIT